MKKRYLILILLVVIAFSCNKKKKTEECEFNKLEFVQYKGKSTDIKRDKTILDCIQLDVKSDMVYILNEGKTIFISYSISSENLIEEIKIDLNKEVNESFNSLDDQEITLIEKDKEWEISFKSENEDKLNGYLKLSKNIDAEYWKFQKDVELSSK